MEISHMLFINNVFFSTQMITFKITPTIGPIWLYYLFENELTRETSRYAWAAVRAMHTALFLDVKPVLP